VSPGYFEAMRIRLRAGRTFDSHDRAGAQPVAVVSRSFARRFWPDRDPIGRRIRRGIGSTWSVVVGVVDDVRDAGIDKDVAVTLYTPFSQGNGAAMPVGLVVRTEGDPALALAAIKRAVWAVDPTQPLANVVTLDRFLADSLGARRFRAALLTLCGIVGLLLATLGTYAMTARVVAERTREVGIRLALGGRPHRVWWTVAWSCTRAVVAGAIAGAVASTAAAVALAGTLPEVNGTAWPFTAGAAAMVVMVGVSAALIAGRAAISIEPMRALR
jgi:putative ABC transport system permease protein